MVSLYRVSSQLPSALSSTWCLQGREELRLAGWGSSPCFSWLFLCAPCKGTLPAVVTALQGSRKVRWRARLSPSITPKDAAAASAMIMHSEQGCCSLSAFSCGRKLMAVLSCIIPLMKCCVNRKLFCCAQSFDDPITKIPLPSIKIFL